MKTIAALVLVEDFKLSSDAMQMVVDAMKYLERQTWFNGADAFAWRMGIPGVIAVLKVQLAHELPSGDKQLWLITGDVPDAYLVVNEDENEIGALDNYLRLMEEWCESVFSNEKGEDTFPVEAKRTKGNASDLIKRIEYIRKIKPDLVRLR